MVYYANYLRFLERARTEWLRARGHSQTALAADPGVLFAVAEVNIRFHRPARLDDLLVISCQPALDGRHDAAVQAAGAPRTASTANCWRRASVRVVCVGSGSFRPRRFPHSIIEGLH